MVVSIDGGVSMSVTDGHLCCPQTKTSQMKAMKDQLDRIDPNLCQDMGVSDIAVSDSLEKALAVCPPPPPRGPPICAVHRTHASRR